MHYFKFNISDWALSTAHLTLEEEAIYLRLVNHYYDSEKPIPLETQSVIRRLRLGSQPLLVVSILEEYFTETDNGFFHNRCEQVLKEYRKTAKKNKANGAKGGRPSKHAASSVSQSEPSGLPVGTQVEPKHNPNQELLTKNQELRTSNQKESKKAPKVAVDFSVFNLPDSDVEEIKRIRRKYNPKKSQEIDTQRIANGLAKEINLAMQSGISLENIFTEWETRGWKSFKAEYMAKNNYGSRPQQQQAISNQNHLATEAWANGTTEIKEITGEVFENG